MPDQQWYPAEPDLLRRIADRSIYYPPTGCWLALFRHPGDNRGRITYGGKKHLSSRAAFFAWHGRWPSLALHSCHNEECNFPGHLYEGTRSQNTLDSVGVGTHNNASKTHCPHGHPYEGDNLIVRRRPDGGEMRVCRTCSVAAGRKTYAKSKARREHA